MSGYEAPNRLFLVVFSHLDLTFMGSQDECLSRGNKIVSLALRHLEEEPDTMFLIEYMIFVENYLAAHPADRQRIRKFVTEGRLQLGLSWSGIYQSSEEEENLVRNIQYARDFARREFGAEDHSLQLTDLPAFTSQMPQVLRKCGIDFCIITRSGPADQPLFLWQALDGSEVLTYYSRGYHEAARLGLHRENCAAEWQSAQEEIKARLAQGPLVIHWGTDMCLPAAQLPRTVRQWNASGFPHIDFATPERLRSELATRGAVPRLRGEMPSVWAYALAAHADITNLDGKANAALALAERYSTLEWLLLGRQRAKTTAVTEQLWKDLLLARDHNFAGKGAAEGQRRKLRDRLRIIAACERIVEDVLRRIAEQVKVPKRSVPIVVFNGQFWEQSGPVEAHISFYPGASGERDEIDIFGDPRAFSTRYPALKDCDGASIPYQLAAEDQSDTLGEIRIIFEAAKVPSLGYKTFWLDPSETYEPSRTRMTRHPAWFRAPVDRTMVRAGDVAVEVDERTGELAVRSRETGRVILERISPFGVEESRVSMLRDLPPRGLSQDSTEEESIREFKAHGVEIVEDGPVRARVLVTGTVFENRIREDIAIYPSGRIDVELTIAWDRSQWNRIEWRVGLPDGNAEVVHGIPFGMVGWNDVMPNSGPSSLRPDESPHACWNRMRIVQKWIRIDSSVDSVVIATSHRLWRRRENSLEAVLVRGGRMAGTFATLHELRYSFSISMGAGAATLDGARRGDEAIDGRHPPREAVRGFDAERSHRLGFDMAMPLVAYVVNDTASEKSRPPVESFVSVEGLDVVVTAFKPADSDDELLVRLFEPRGHEGRARFRFAPELQLTESGWDASLCGDRSQEEGEYIRLKPYEITARLFQRRKQPLR